MAGTSSDSQAVFCRQRSTAIKLHCIT